VAHAHGKESKAFVNRISEARVVQRLGVICTNVTEAQKCLCRMARGVYRVARVVGGRWAYANTHAAVQIVGESSVLLIHACLKQLKRSLTRLPRYFEQTHDFSPSHNCKPHRRPQRPKERIFYPEKAYATVTERQTGRVHGTPVLTSRCRRRTW
jgi:hypothetical protein